MLFEFVAIIGDYLLERESEILIDDVVLVNVMQIIFISVMVWSPLRIFSPEPLEHILFSFSNVVITMRSIIHVSWIFVVRIVFMPTSIVIRISVIIVLDHW